MANLPKSPCLFSGARAPSAARAFGAALAVLMLTAGGGCAANLGGEFSTDRPTRPEPGAPGGGVHPTIVLLQPALGSVLPAGEVRFQGRVDDDGPVTLATDDGQTVPVAADGSFDHWLPAAPGSHRVRLVATDGSGHTGEAFTVFAAGDFQASGTVVEDAVLAGVSTQVLDAVASEAAALLTETSFNRQLAAQNPISDEWWGEVNLTGETHYGVAIALVPGAGRITASVEIARLAVGARASTPIGSASGELQAAGVAVTATLLLRADGGRLVAAVESSRVELGDAVIDISHFPDAIEDIGALRDSIRRKAETALDEAVRDMLPPLVVDAIASIPTGDEIEVLETPLALTVGVGALDIDPLGVDLALDLGLRALAPDAARDAMGYLSVPRTGAPAPADDLSVAVAFDTLNAAFAALWAGGGLDQRIDGLEFGGGPLTVGTLGLLLPFAAAAAPAGAPLVIDVAPQLPPMAVAGPTGALEVQAADLRVAFIALVDGAEVEVAVLSVGIFASADARVEGGSLALDLGALDISADVIGGGPTAPTGEELGALIDDLLTTLAPDLLGGAAVAIPSVSGFDLVPTSVSTAGGYLVLEAALE